MQLYVDILAVASVTNSVVPHGARAHLAKAASEVLAKREPKPPPSRGTVIGRDKRGTGTGVRKVVTPVWYVWLQRGSPQCHALRAEWPALEDWF